MLLPLPTKFTEKKRLKTKFLKLTLWLDWSSKLPYVRLVASSSRQCLVLYYDATGLS